MAAKRGSPALKVAAIRLPEDSEARADALAVRMAAEEELAGYRVTRSSVLRRAIIEGLRVLEDRYRKGCR